MTEILLPHEDDYGNEIYDYFTRKTGYEIIERDDGYLDTSDGPLSYFAEFKEWPFCEMKAIEYARGPVLDVGPGSGRVSLYLQNKGIETVGIDNSPLATTTASMRGVKNVKLVPFGRITEGEFPYETIVMFGNNFGLFHNRENARKMLRKIHELTGSSAQFLVESLDPYRTDSKDSIEYHQYNKSRGQNAGPDKHSSALQKICHTMV